MERKATSYPPSSVIHCPPSHLQHVSGYNGGKKKVRKTYIPFNPQGAVFVYGLTASVYIKADEEGGAIEDGICEFGDG